MTIGRSLRIAVAALLAIVLMMAVGSRPAQAANENHPYGVLPYGFAYPTDAHIWAALNIVYHYDMLYTFNWGPHGPGYYGCGPGCQGPYGYSGCCGLTPPHYNAIAPASFVKPYSETAGLSYYNFTPVAYQPIPGWDIPEYPPGVWQHPSGYTSMHGFRPYTKRTTTPGGIWYAGREMEMNFWASGPTYPSQRP